jgi:tripartite-type tricarboxylate transporter receptor subunit TctC
MNDRRTTLAALALSLAAPRFAAAQSWPARPIKLVVPFPPGGGTDLAARIVGERLAAKLGQPVVVDNKPGASTAIGVSLVSAAEPDGYTLLFSGSTSFTVNPAVRTKLGYDPFKQLTPIARVCRTPLVLVTAAQGGDTSLKQTLSRAAARPGAITYATFGAGSAPHLAGELLATAAGVKLMAVPYKGSAEAAIGVMRGDVTLGVDTLASARPHVMAGKMRALAVVSDKRTPLLPQVPAYGELQLSSALLDGWYALAGPAGLPEGIRDTLLRAVTGVLAEPGVREKLAAQSMDAALLGPQALRELMDQEIARYRAAVARSGMRLD